MEIKYVRTKCEEFVEGFKKLANDLMGKSIMYSSIDEEDIYMIKRTQKIYEDFCDLTTDYTKQMNYNTELLEDLYRNVKSMNDRLEKIEESINK